MDDLPQYTIGTVARRTGLSTHVIRAWERRYGVVEPGRSDGGTRLYTSGDVLRLRLLRQATERGVAIGQAARLGTDELLSMAGGSGGDSVGGNASSWRTAEAFTLPILSAIESMDGDGLRASLMRAMASLGVKEFTGSVAIPILHRVGELWESETICPAQEHLFTVHLRRVLEWLLESLPVQRGAPGLVATTLSGETHELGAMLAGVTAATEGWRVEYLGPDLPPSAIAVAAHLTDSRVILVSAVTEAAGASLVTQGEGLQAALPDDVSIIAGGVGAIRYADALRAARLRLVPDLDALADTLRALAPVSGPSAGGLRG